MQCKCNSCQAKVQVQVQSLKLKFKVKSKVFKSKRTWTLLTLLSYSPPTTHPPPPPLNFSSSSRSPTVKCYTFLETSHDFLLELHVICKFLQLIIAKRENELKKKDKERKSQISFAWPSRLQSSSFNSHSCKILSGFLGFGKMRGR